MMNQWPNIAEISRQEWQERAKQKGWWLLVDSAINSDVLNFIPAPQPQSRLYWDEMGEVHASISPYLIPMHSIDWLDENITHKSNWGMAIQINEAFHYETLDRQQEILLSHLRTWSLAQAPEQEVAILRINDWSIFHVLWNATAAEKQPELKGPIQSLCYWEAEDESAFMSSLTGDMNPEVLVKTPIQLTDEQYLGLSNWADRHQHQKYREHLQQHHQDTHKWSEDEWKAFLSQQTKQARDYGFEQPNDVVRYLSLSVVMGKDFIDTSWAKEVLSKPSHQGKKSHMDQLFAQALKQLNEESSTS
ncbi:DUF4123 domain-containing protein [Vibrio rotiferianus]|uniref:DUF4123 domain-containing protein n=1 Tax=Vibrio rotiferianus TaxID=190895 RepID=A0A7Y3ZDY3_9VIBR|nr:DUF4123 domain-containing protein [Vibrio rotiferianus]NOH51172.1 DUF4123 domain-containing protein [Vibrio rotiferianus]